MSLDRYGGAVAADAYYTGLDVARAKELAAFTCAECRKYHASPIQYPSVGWCEYLREHVWGNDHPADIECEEFERE